jgi:hypothetical protein
MAALKMTKRGKENKLKETGCTQASAVVDLGSYHHLYFIILYISIRSRVSSGSIVSDYGLDDRAIGVRSLAGAEDFSSSLCVQTGSGAHPASCTMSTGGKARPGRDAYHSPPSSADVVNE